MKKFLITATLVFCLSVGTGFSLPSTSSITFPRTISDTPVVAKVLSLTLDRDSFEVKDNVFITVGGFTDNLRLKVFSPDLTLIQTYGLAVDGQYFFQGMDPGRYLIEASDNTADTFKIVTVLKASPSEDPTEQLSEDSKTILFELNKLIYEGVKKDCELIATIFEEEAINALQDTTMTSQKLIDETFTKLKPIVNQSEMTKQQWGPFLSFLQKFYSDKEIPSANLEDYLTLWGATSIAFKRRSK